MSIGRWTNTLVAGINENSLSLANFNFDFCVIKVTAPDEYAALGEGMSAKRRHDAENGILHQTARFLGALFSQLIPSTPSLHRSFGIRASEITQAPGANPRGSPNDGPFKDWVGLDAASIWACATSGPASISVVLLACMLARKISDPKVSVSLWVELISMRQAEI